MAEKILYKPAYLAEVLEEVTEKFYFKAEFPKKKRNPDDTLNYIQKFEGRPLTGYQLEDLILALGDKPSDAVVKALSARVTNRIMGLLWAYFQYDYKNVYVLLLLTDISRKYNANLFDISNGHLIFTEDFLTHPIESVLDMTKNADIREFIKEYGIIENSPYWRDLLTYLFMNSTPDTIRENFGLLYHFINVSEKLPDEVFVHYMESFDALEYSTEVNLLLIQKLGLPGSFKEGGEKDFWEQHSPEIRRKILNWHKLHNMNLHLEQKKFALYTNYLEDIQEVVFERRNKLLKIMFKLFAIVDNCDDSSVSVYFANPNEVKDVESIDPEVIHVSSKDFMVSKTDDLIMTLSVFGINRMYTKEMLDILLGKATDYRKD
ncbi:hypothetical protein AGMMS49975_21000 [Clostridia bacterium]|nr:hypothetical protein AGMMS49975_21000 [Clostridia bacterium]